MIPDRIAPPGKYRVLGIDRFDDDHWIEGDWETLVQALADAIAKTAAARPHASDASIATVYYVYDDQGGSKGQRTTGSV